mgnify:CR=1 FL=1
MSWLYAFIDLLFWALNLAILIRVVLSWVNVSPYNPFASFIYQITDPIIEPLRRIVPPMGMLDLTPMVAWMLLIVVQRILHLVLAQFVL